MLLRDAGCCGAGLSSGVCSGLSYAEWVPEEALTGVQKSRTKSVESSARSMIKPEPEAPQGLRSVCLLCPWEVLLEELCGAKERGAEFPLPAPTLVHGVGPGLGQSRFPPRAWLSTGASHQGQESWGCSTAWARSPVPGSDQRSRTIS